MASYFFKNIESEMGDNRTVVDQECPEVGWLEPWEMILVAK